MRVDTQLTNSEFPVPSAFRCYGNRGINSDPSHSPVHPPSHYATGWSGHWRPFRACDATCGPESREDHQLIGRAVLTEE